MREILIVGAGGFAGSILRYLVSRAMLSCVAVSGFPFATLTVNVIGSLLIRRKIRNKWRLVSAGRNRILRRVHDVLHLLVGVCHPAPLG